jgi:hypothetical protein
MSLVMITSAQTEANRESYKSEYLKWKGYYDKIPILRSTINAVADAVAASWNTYGNNGEVLRPILNNFEGNGKETFKTLMRNAVATGMICGDAYFEIVYNDDLGVENLVMLPSDNIKVIIKNGRIKRYEEITQPTGENAAKWRPEEIFHYVNNQIGASVHGNSDIEPLNDLLIWLKQVQTDYADIMHNYAIPKELLSMDTDDPTEMQKILDKWISMKNRGYKVMAYNKDDVEPKAFSVPVDLDPSAWHELIIKQILASMRVPDLALGTGTVNSEESARMKYSGFRQLVRMKQQLLEEQLQRQLFPQIFPEDTPSIEFSFAAEPAEERFNRMMSAIQTISAIDFDPKFKSLLVLDMMQKGGILPYE